MLQIEVEARCRATVKEPIMPVVHHGVVVLDYGGRLVVGAKPVSAQVGHQLGFLVAAGTEERIVPSNRQDGGPFEGDVGAAIVVGLLGIGHKIGDPIPSDLPPSLKALALREAHVDDMAPDQSKFLIGT